MRVGRAACAFTRSFGASPSAYQSSTSLLQLSDLIIRNTFPKQSYHQFATSSSATASVTSADSDISNPTTAPLLNSSWLSTFRAENGTEHCFATAVIDDASPAGAPMAAWDHVCKLIGGHPTAVIAFVSHPTASAMSAIGEISSRLADGNGSSPQSIGEAQEKYIPPLIGCVASGWTGPAGELNPDAWRSEIGQIKDRIKEKRRWVGGEEDTGRGLQQHWAQSLGVGLGSDDSKREGCGVRSEQQFPSTFEMPSRIEGGDAEDGGDGDVDGDGVGGEDSVSDWADLVEEYEAVKGEEVGGESVRSLFGPVLSEEEKGAGSGNFVDPSEAQDRSSRRSDGTEMANVWAAGLEEKRGQVGGRHKGLGDEIATMLGLAGLEGSVAVRRKVREREVEDREDSSLRERADAEVGKRLAAVGGLGGGGTGKFRLQLFAARMPGIRASAFMAPSTGVPEIANLERLILDTNPHILLVGAPGYCYPDLLERLDTIFPEGLSAGAFLYPLFNEQGGARATQGEGGSQERVGGVPIFCGGDMAYSGAVGLALTTTESSGVPSSSVFSEFVRMAVAYPCIPAKIWVDPAVSQHIFAPKPPSSEYPSDLLVPLEQLRVKTRETENAWEASVRFTSSVEPESSWKLPSGVTQLQSRVDKDESVRGRGRPIMPFAIFGSCPYPGWIENFQIYEPRYRLLVRQCVETDSPCGIILPPFFFHTPSSLTSQKPSFLIGIATRLRVVKFEDDYTSRIEAHGLRRFRFRSSDVGVLAGSFGLSATRVEFFDDEAVVGEVEQKKVKKLAQRACRLTSRLIERGYLQAGPSVGMRFQNPWLMSDTEAASFALANVLTVSPYVKARWLMVTDTNLRLLEIMSYLKGLAPRN